ncbi:unnamed protein product [Phytophthora fragariaefolia]|uniref:Unnamed protein product n=1 Tax=Phytophthora fragariaefolia TaxID=1490495 RepID=A0A9W6TS48_9STRA|nr:unnamed protein product [Phytophthora fragariaefolia]
MHQAPVTCQVRHAVDQDASPSDVLSSLWSQKSRSIDRANRSQDPAVTWSSMMSVRLPSVRRGAQVYKSQVTPKRRMCLEQMTPLKIQVPRHIEGKKIIDSQRELTLNRVYFAF